MIYIFLERYDDVLNKYDEYMAGERYLVQQHLPKFKKRTLSHIFHLRLGLHESLPVYAGGLGILSGDHLKAASDLGNAFGGSRFYLQARIFYSINLRRRMAGNPKLLSWISMKYRSSRLLDERGKPLIISVELPGREVFARIWQVMCRSGFPLSA